MEYDYVQLSPETFLAARREYSNWRLAWVREIMQNAIDAGATWIEVNINPGGLITVSDNGCGMTEDILRNKLFVVNASGKNCENNQVGGFGKAKELLYFGQAEYTIYTNDLVVHGYANRYKITKAEKEIKGTCAEVKMLDKDFMVENWSKYFMLFMSRSTWTGGLLINKLLFDGRAKVDSEICKEFPFGKIRRSVDQELKKLVVRVGGVFMFDNYSDIGLYLDLEGKSYDLLTSNRDGLLDDPRVEIQQFMNKLAKDTTSALMKERCKIDIYKSDKGCLRRLRKKVVTENPQEVIEHLIIPKEIKVSMRDSFGCMTEMIIEQERWHRTSLPYSIMISNNLPGDIPDAYLPNNLSINARWVLAAWSCAIYSLYELFDREAEFYTGFVFSNKVEAEYSISEGRPTYLLNPCDSEYKIKFPKNRATVCHIIALALHEFIHGEGYSYHDETYANKLTDYSIAVFEQLPHLTKKITRAIEGGF